MEKIQNGKLRLDLDMLPKAFSSSKSGPKVEGVAQFFLHADLITF